MDNRARALLAVLAVLPLLVQAGEVYRSVDAEGNVTYTDKPSSDDSAAERIELPPGPSRESIRDSVERNSAIRKAMEEAREKRLEQQASREERMAKARKEWDEAKDKLKQTKEIGEDDRQTFVGGKSRIKPEYFERVQEAEAALEAARKQFKEIRGY
ncbi:MAG: DUF4124 domain-containing protein [Candidatus Thiodiazotropha sp. (ex Epidulcina cf. delphinae)]|nr:DUF4124 domain-containing protein [Candidatus Thiodiazotropha sp. (ex Epidulcina cf. delphinae)]